MNNQESKSSGQKLTAKCFQLCETNYIDDVVVDVEYIDNSGSRAEKYFNEISDFVEPRMFMFDYKGTFYGQVINDNALEGYFPQEIQSILINTIVI